MNSRHAEVRQQQRGLPPIVDLLLDQYGREAHDGHGAVIVYLDKAGRRQIERDWGHRVVARNWELLDCYKVRSTDGTTITTGHRTRRIRRKS